VALLSLIILMTDVISQAGFGWTNGVALWIASHYGKVVVAPNCPNLLEVPEGPPTGAATSKNGALPTSGDLLGGGLPGAAAAVMMGALVHLMW
jgi:alpha,alpha-trehalase